MSDEHEKSPLELLQDHVWDFIADLTDDPGLPQSALDRAFADSEMAYSAQFDALCAEITRLVDTRLELGLVPGKEGSA